MTTKKLRSVAEAKTAAGHNQVEWDRFYVSHKNSSHCLINNLSSSLTKRVILYTMHILSGLGDRFQVTQN